MTCEAVRAELEEAGMAVQTLHSPFGFVKALREHRPVVVLLDVGLGIVNGTKLVPLGRRYGPPRMKIVLFSTRENYELLDAIQDCHADGYIRKRAANGELAAQVRDWASRARDP
ncbi:MAG: response regulator [Polyangiaceae bacterium]|nr:response regulator [Polyangiaceae bacterium]